MSRTTGSRATGPLAGRRVLVLGAAGFVGRWVAGRAAAEGADLWLTVRDEHAAAAVFARHGVEGTVVPTRLESSDEVRRVVREARPAVTFNLVGYGVDRSERDDRVSDAVNDALVGHLLEALAQSRDVSWGGTAFVHAGSALEYGEVGGDLDETTAEVPTTVYGRTKLAGTRRVTAASASLLPAVTARLFTLYGPGEHAGRLLPSLLAGRGRSDRIPLSLGLQERDFTFVADVAEGFVRLAAARSPHPVMNLATGRLATVRRFAEEAAAVIGLAPERLGFGDVPQRTDDMRHDPVAVARLVATLGWRPETDIPAGVAATLAFEAARG